jgi:hypothetical protein
MQQSDMSNRSSSSGNASLVQAAKSQLSQIRGRLQLIGRLPTDWHPLVNDSHDLALKPLAQSLTLQAHEIESTTNLIDSVSLILDKITDMPIESGELLRMVELFVQRTDENKRSGQALRESQGALKDLVTSLKKDFKKAEERIMHSETPNKHAAGEQSQSGHNMGLLGANERATIPGDLDIDWQNWPGGDKEGLAGADMIWLSLEHLRRLHNPSNRNTCRSPSTKADHPQISPKCLPHTCNNNSFIPIKQASGSPKIVVWSRKEKKSRILSCR